MISDNTVYKFHNAFPKEFCDEILKSVPASSVREHHLLTWEQRTLEVPVHHPLVTSVMDYLNKKFPRCNLACKESQIQLWPISIDSQPHTHINDSVRKPTPYSSLLYLNDNYDGGEFYTEHEQIKPEPGLLTFFNGHKILHGVRPVYTNHRYTVIFWIYQS